MPKLDLPDALFVLGVALSWGTLAVLANLAVATLALGLVMVLIAVRMAR